MDTSDPASGTEQTLMQTLLKCGQPLLIIFELYYVHITCGCVSRGRAGCPKTWLDILEGQELKVQS